MTPTLIGRWQTRIFMFSTVGVLCSLPFYLGVIGNHNSDPVFFLILLYLGIFGLAWDLLYDFWQKFLWDHDWPGIFQFFTAIAEGIFLATIVKTVGVPLIEPQNFDLWLFVQHYVLVWVAIYLCSWVIMRLLFPRWRFRGGEWLGKWPYNPN